MKQFAKFALVGFAMSASHAYAVVDVQLMGGARSAKLEYEVLGEKREKTVKSTELGFAAHVSPAKTVPVAFGVFANMNKYDASPIIKEQVEEEPMEDFTFNDPTSTIAGTTYGPEVMAWVPIPMFKPFLRASYVMGSYDYKNKAELETDQFEGKLEQTITYKTTGYNVGLGFIYSPIPLLGLIAEYNVGSEKLTATKGKSKFSGSFGGVTDESEDTFEASDMEEADRKKDLGSSAIRLGLSLSI